MSLVMHPHGHAKLCQLEFVTVASERRSFLKIKFTECSYLERATRISHVYLLVTIGGDSRAQRTSWKHGPWS